MRRVSIFLMSMLTIMSCVRENEPALESNLHEVVFHAGWDGDTKTVLQEDGSVWWSPGDEISVFVGCGNDGGYKFTSTNTTASASVTFTGILGDEEGKYVALYPYNKDAYYDGEYVYTNIPTEQVAVEGSFNKDVLLSLAVSDDNNLYFRNICSGIKFSVSDDKIKSIDFIGRNSYLSGDVRIRIDGDEPYCEMYGDIRSTITVTAPEGGYFQKGKWYYAITSSTISSGMDIVYHKDTEMAVLYMENDVELKRSIFKKLEEKDSGLEFKKSIARLERQYNLWYMIFSDGRIEQIDRSVITKVIFHPSSSKKTEAQIFYDGDKHIFDPIYFEMQGTEAHYYTSAPCVDVLDAGGLFEGFSSLTSYDVSCWDTSKSTDFGGLFSSCTALADIDLSFLNTSNATNMDAMFRNCSSLEKLDLKGLDTRKVKRMDTMFYGCDKLKSLDLSGFNTSNVEIMSYMFVNCSSLKELDLSMFDTQNVTQMYSMFEYCKNLEHLNISGFRSDNLESANGLFNQCFSLLSIDMGTFDLSKVPDVFAMAYKLARNSRNCAILCTPETKAALLSDDTLLYRTKQYIKWFEPGDTLPEMSRYYDPSIYYSSDYSMDKKVKYLNKATEGDGVNIVLLGEAYSDRLIKDGTYDKDMKAAMDNIFSMEPFKSYKNLFNVIQVYAVSENERQGDNTVFNYYNWEMDDPDNRFGPNGLVIDRDEWMISEYETIALDGLSNKQKTTMIIVHDERYGGAALIEGSENWSHDEYHDYAAKLDGVALVQTNYDNYHYTVCHEFGHAFAALYEEYVQLIGEMETWESDSMKAMQEHLGWYRNVSFTSDPQTIGWSRFLADSRYKGKVSILEGANYSNGIWRSTDESMMNAGGEYSVPARESIYKTIHKLAYGDSWQYDYESFVQQDLKSVYATKSARPDYVQKRVQHQKPFMKIERSKTADGKNKVTVIMN